MEAEARKETLWPLPLLYVFFNSTGLFPLVVITEGEKTSKFIFIDTHRKFSLSCLVSIFEREPCYKSLMITTE